MVSACDSYTLSSIWQGCSIKNSVEMNVRFGAEGLRREIGSVDPPFSSSKGFLVDPGSKTLKI